MIWEYVFLTMRVVCLSLWWGTWGLVGMALCFTTKLILWAVGLAPHW